MLLIVIFKVIKYIINIFSVCIANEKLVVVI